MIGRGNMGNIYVEIILENYIDRILSKKGTSRLEK